MTKFLFTILASLSILTVSFSQDVKENKVDKKKPVLVFEKVLHDFGSIEYDGNGTCEFVYKNTGKEPLILSNVKASCGCTIPEWSKEPLKKGGTASIKVKYDTKRQGNFTKTITVTSNAKNATEVLTIKGNVKPSPNTENKEIKTNSGQIKKEGIKRQSLDKKELNISIPQNDSKK
ncbi:MAG: hypothetical protein A2033_18690 [Bacteroidetes bacterium GWA2_31_9]|nr:MAG: hypothetical protein A2033_18690 [Bacteroidetes bacterium GWA2_31_9]